MKISIKFLAITALFFTFSFAANAQRGGEKKAMDPETMAEKQTTQMVEKLSLDEAQTEKISAINLVYAKKMHASHEANKEDRDAMKEIKTTLNTEQAAEIKEVLTEEQFKTYQEMQSKGEKGGRGEKRGKGGKGGRRS